MSRDSYMAALLAMGMREHQSTQLVGGGADVLCADPPYSIAVSMTPTLRNRQLKAIAYLRERKLYCLDRQQPRIPPQARPQTLLDKWMKERHK